MKSIFYNGNNVTVSSFLGGDDIVLANPGIVTDGLLLNYDTSTYISGSSTIMDLSGNGNIGTLNNGVTYLNDFGGILDFSGSFYTVSSTGVGQNISAVDSVSLDQSFTTGVTFELWINLDQVNGAAQNRTNLLFSKRTTSSDGYFGAYNTGSFVFRIGNAPAAGSAIWFTTPQTGSFQQVVCTIGFSGTASPGSIIYGNGVSKVSQMGLTAPYSGGASRNNTTSLLFGDINPAAANVWTFDGKLGAYRIYNRKLTASEVLQNYNAVKSRFGL